MTKHQKRTTSAAHIQVPEAPVGDPSAEHQLPAAAQPSSSISDEQRNAIFRGFRQLLRDCRGSSKNDQAIVLIKAIIEQGWNIRARIVGTAQRLGFSSDHINTVLRNGTGNNPQRHHWKVDAMGIYSLHDQAATPHASDGDNHASQRQ